MCSQGEPNVEQRTVTRTFRLKLHSLTKRKNELLTREHNTFNQQIRSTDKLNLYSVTRQQANRLEDINKDTQHPLILRNDKFSVEAADETNQFNNWIKLPVYNPNIDRGDSIWCPVHIPEYARQPVLNGDQRDSQLVRDGDTWFVSTILLKHNIV